MRTWLAAVAAALLGLVFMVSIRLPGMSDFAILLVSNGGQLAAAAAASVGCAIAARRATGHRRTAWWWLSVGTGCWAAGQVVWSYYEVVLDREVPFPSLADVGFLLFPLVAAVGLVIWLGTQGAQLVARTRDLFDGAIIACSLLVISWVTTLGSVVAAGADSWFPLVLSLAYPVGDLILATLVLLALARGARIERATLALLALGLGGLAFADSAYVYLTSIGAYSSADLASSGWVFGFLFVAAAGVSVRRRDEMPATVSMLRPQHDVSPKPSMLRLTLPYVPLVAAGLTLWVSLLSAPNARVVELLLAVALMTFVLTRQFLAMADNQRLLGALAEARDQLEHQALHDALTGLANRVLFADRLDRALLRPDADVSVLFCDLDDFKVVNDQYGHEVGDDLLKLVARRLLDCVRVTDTVARLGGDEFAILIEDSMDAVQVADRIVTNVHEPLEVRGWTLRTSISVGIAHHRGVAGTATEDDRRDHVLDATPRTRAVDADDMAATAAREATAALLLRTADTAMYAAKGAGKSRAVLADIVANRSLST
jgi:diguanylate cyclase (GGDEF)-like protein